MSICLSDISSCMTYNTSETIYNKLTHLSSPQIFLLIPKIPGKGPYTATLLESGT